jgi:putative ribosome biogenesis GTPase RsgA
MMIDPELQLWVGDVMDIGRPPHHNRRYAPSPRKGGYIADTPGIKTVSL